MLYVFINYHLQNILTEPRKVYLKPMAVFQVPFNNTECNNKDPDASMMPAAVTKECVP